MQRLGIISVAIALLTNAAVAADVAVKAPQAPPPAFLPFTWTGAYAGASGGFGWSSGGLDASGGFGGGQIG
jgi:outer membrane immunogenic protein